MRRLTVAALLAVLLLPPALPAAAAGAEEGEVVVSTWSFVSPGMSEKRGCRLRVVIENKTPVSIGFSGKFRTFLKGVEKDAWFVTTTRIPPKGQTERLYACVIPGDTLELDRTSDYGYPRICEVEGENTSPCPFKLRQVSNLVITGQ
ncbi:hypothetical protein [Magnetospirillum fulvum]|jgi:hypothetical protein|uniref:Uncharacterized protein n=1 Tax=Magnetospirillum fulvum TaxID=1082 RepID=A0A1H6H1F5_MAGFU|nr:hypothetical protein [Magnetospirillum fulvum]SEH27974.1 hypothetical protein SAMN04244559_00629 [Magnetospirillum fulvum]